MKNGVHVSLGEDLSPTVNPFECVWTTFYGRNTDFSLGMFTELKLNRTAVRSRETPICLAKPVHYKLRYSFQRVFQKSFSDALLILTDSQIVCVCGSSLDSERLHIITKSEGEGASKIYCLHWAKLGT